MHACQKYDNLMIDLETLGTSPGCVVLSVGAVPFNRAGTSEYPFYEEISIPKSEAYALFIDPKTQAWWAKQGDEPRALLSRCYGLEDMPGPDVVLKNLTKFIQEHCEENVRIWGNGASFDEPILKELYHVVGQKEPWGYWGTRCYRTLKALGDTLGVKEAPPQGIKHNALSDACNQAEYAVAVLREIIKKD